MNRHRYLRSFRSSEQTWILIIIVYWSPTFFFTWFIGHINNHSVLKFYFFSAQDLLDHLKSSEYLSNFYDSKKLKAFYPKSRREFVITMSLGVLSVIVITYFMAMLYKCMCSRNYSRWRHSWARHYARRQRSKGAYYKQIKESLPLMLKGHNQVWNFKQIIYFNL